MSFKAQIKELAKQIGFDQVGITRPGALEEGENAIRDWVREGKHGTMRYLEEFEARRERFFNDFPDAKSVIVLGVNYFTGQGAGGRGQGERLAGRVARYAWGKDYHKVIRKKHEALIEQLRQIVGSRGDPRHSFRAKSCVDTQPLPERYAARKAGLGFIGKHTGLLSREFGPWLFLSEIVTNLELEEDLPAAGDCGACNYCQKVCPTGALDQDYKIDARLCIAYLTIEHKGVIPRELRPKIKDWIFGCDECLNICPFGSKLSIHPDPDELTWPEFLPESGFGSQLDIGEFFEIRSNREYQKRFAETALSRTTRKQMLRNACIVLGNSGRAEALPYLKKALKDASSLVRLHAAWALGRLDMEEARKILEQHHETDPEVLEEVRLAGQKTGAIV